MKRITYRQADYRARFTKEGRRMYCSTQATTDTIAKYEELLEQLGYKERKTYSTWISSGNIPTSALVKMSDLFNCSIDYLLGRTQNPSPPA